MITGNPITEKIKDELKDSNLNDTVEKVVKRLESFNYSVEHADVWPLAFTISKVQHYILAETNQRKIPDGLQETAADMICGEFLLGKYYSGNLQLSSLTLGETVKTLTEGDTTITFDSGSSDDARAQALLKWLTTGKGCDFTCYRRMSW